MKKGIKKQLYNNFIGAIDDRDEYQKQEINRELAVAGMGLFSFVIIFMFILLIIDTINNTLSVGTIGLFVIIYLYSLYIIIKLRKNKLNDTECSSEQNYKLMKKSLKKQGVKAGFMWGFFMLVTNTYLLPFLDTGNSNASWFDFILWSVMGSLFGIIMYLFAISKLQKVY